MLHQAPFDTREGGRLHGEAGKHPRDAGCTPEGVVGRVQVLEDARWESGKRSSKEEGRRVRRGDKGVRLQHERLGRVRELHSGEGCDDAADQWGRERAGGDDVPGGGIEGYEWGRLKTNSLGLEDLELEAGVDDDWTPELQRISHRQFDKHVVVVQTNTGSVCDRSHSNFLRTIRSKGSVGNKYVRGVVEVVLRLLHNLFELIRCEQLRSWQGAIYGRINSWLRKSLSIDIECLCLV
mmetsp:Transcript_9979/g.17378  ORF Transcript_9979/g.17378 Transcript_9979/m.17378 type:complete len:237 (+) Transcript_9979:650-1360(+)